MMKKLTVLLIALICTATLAQDLPRIAVYVTGDVHDNEKKALGTRMLASLINSGRYMGIERSNSFLAELEKEQEKQRSGAIDDGQISELGRQFGVRFVCIADITPAFGSYQVSARIVDVETAVVVSIGESYSGLQTSGDLKQVSDEVVKAMFKGWVKPDPKQAAQAPRQEKPPKTKPSLKLPKEPAFWAGIGLDALGVGMVAYGLYENGNVKSQDESGVYDKAEKAAKGRNIAYTVGISALLAGISIQILF